MPNLNEANDQATADDQEFNEAQNASLAALESLKDMPGDRHDLTIMTGIGPKTEAKLNRLGIKSFSQIAEMSEDQIDAVDHLLNLGGRPVVDDWQDQATSLLNAMGSDEADEERPLEPEDDEAERDILDRTLPYTEILGTSTPAQTFQAQKYFDGDDREMTDREARLEALPAPVVPAARRRRSRYDTEKVNLTAWARGLKRYPAGAIFDTMQDRCHVQLESEIAVIDYMLDHKMVLPHQLHRSFQSA